MVFRKRSESPLCSSRAMVGEVLEPVMEGPSPSMHHSKERRTRREVKEWVKEQIEKTTSHLLHLGQGGLSNSNGTNTSSSNRRVRAKQLLASLGVSLGPFPVGKLPPTVCPKDSPIETSSAQYIVQQFIAATGGSKLHNSIHNTYATGRFKMQLTDFESPGTSGSQFQAGGTAGQATNSYAAGGLSSSWFRECSDSGCFVLWQMRPDKWYVEMALRGIKLRSGCDSKLVWRQSPVYGSQAIRGPIRPLRRSLNGLDPTTLASMFLNARCIGEKRVGQEDCFVLKLAADPFTLNTFSGPEYRAVRPDSPTVHSAVPPVGNEAEEEVIRHVAFGYFSQRSGLLVRMEDSRLTRVTSVPRGEVSYWEVTVESVMGEYRAVSGSEGLVVAHAGSTVVSIFRFGEESMCHSRTRVEETWWIDDVALNVVGLSAECFMPPADCVNAATSAAASDVDVQQMFLH